jgi:hypothetical protein
MRRRDFLATAATVASMQAQETNAIVVDPKPLFENLAAPLLYMQFMEPLGTTDSAVEASWDYNADDWRNDFVAITRDLANRRNTQNCRFFVTIPARPCWMEHRRA